MSHQDSGPRDYVHKDVHDQIVGDLELRVKKLESRLADNNFSSLPMTFDVEGDITVHVKTKMLATERAVDVLLFALRTKVQTVSVDEVLVRVLRVDGKKYDG